MMKNINFTTRKSISRRTVLKGMGVSIALPMLGAMNPAFASSKSTVSPRRFFGVCNNLGFLTDRFFPNTSGKDYELSPYLNEIKELKDKFTVFSGVSHPGVDGSHSSDVSFLTAAPHPGGGGFRNTISLDQFIAEKSGHLTRFPSISLGVNAKEGRRGLSFTDAGVLIPCQNKPSEVYKQLFVQGSEKEIAKQIRKLVLGQSIMDTIAGEAKSFQSKLGREDQDRLDQYFNSVREVEKRMQNSQNWVNKAKPKTSEKMPEGTERSEYFETAELMYKMTKLAFETDSTRSMTLLLDSNNSPAININGESASDGYHNLSHHGKTDKKLGQLDAIDRTHIKLLGKLMKDLEEVNEEGGSLLDHTSIFFGSNFGDANKHTTDNMPIILAGGKFKHGQHLAFDVKHNEALPNVFVSILQQMGYEESSFATGRATMKGLEFSS